MSNDRQAAASDKTGGRDAARLPIPGSRLSLAASPFAKELIPQDLARTIASQIPTTNLKNAMTQVAAAISIQQKDVSKLASQAGTFFAGFSALQVQLASIRSSLASLKIPPELTATIRRITNPKLWEIMDESQWPLYLVVVDKPELRTALLNDNLKILDRIHHLEANRDATDQTECLRVMVYERAREFLDDAWVTDTGVEWESSDAVSEGMTHMGLIALDLHRKQEYAGCTAILMGLLNGLIETDAAITEGLSPHVIAEHNLRAKAHGINPIQIGKGKQAKRIPVKSRFILGLILTKEEKNHQYLEKAVSYLTTVVETNSKTGWARMGEHNPLRNKICHGDQTNYNTWEHSVKAILSFDMVVHLISTIHHLKDADMPSETDMTPSPAAS